MRDHFAKILGAEHALDNPNDLLAYGYDASGMEGKARIVLFPSSEEHLRQILTYANRTNIPIVARGLGTNPTGAVVPENSIVLDMKRFDRVHTINLKEGWVLVDCGVVLSDLQAMLSRHEREFPINPQSADVATIGGLLGLNQMDKTSYKKGRLREHVLDLEMIDGTGKHYPSGNPEFIGMEGAGAIIIRAKIKIYPKQELQSTDLQAFDHITDLLAAVSQKEDDFSVQCLEYINPTLAQMMGLPAEHTLLTGYGNEKGDIQGEKHETLWKKRDDAWKYASRKARPIIGDCQADKDNSYDIIEWAERREIPMAGHIGMGIFHPFMKEEEKEEWNKFLHNVAAHTAGQFGYGRVKKGQAHKKKREALFRLKDQYDYNDIINRGVIHEYK